MDVSRGGPSFALMCKEKESRVSSHSGDMPSVTEASGGFMAMHVANIADDRYRHRQFNEYFHCHLMPIQTLT